MMQDKQGVQHMLTGDGSDDHEDDDDYDVAGQARGAVHGDGGRVRHCPTAQRNGCSYNQCHPPAVCAGDESK